MERVGPFDGLRARVADWCFGSPLLVRHCCWPPLLRPGLWSGGLGSGVGGRRLGRAALLWVYTDEVGGGFGENRISCGNVIHSKRD